MLKFIKKLFKSKPEPRSESVPAEFSTYAAKAIELIAASSGQLEDKEILDLFIAEGIPDKEATELLLFLPIAFCRHLLTEVNWPDYYVEYVSDRPQQVLYLNNLRYTAIQQALLAYLAGDFRREDYHKIAGRCASFHALNSLLLQHPGTKLRDLVVTPEHILR